MPSELHEQLVERAARWLRSTGRCNIVLCGLVAANEVPDAIGWRYGCRSTLIECKAYYPDFARDSRKRFRKDPTIGIGARRYYMTPPGLVKPEELPAGWGLLEAYPHKIAIVRQAVDGDCRNNTGLRSEMRILVSALRRVQVRLGSVTLNEHLAIANRPPRGGR